MIRRLFALTVLVVALAPIIVAAQGSQPPHGTQSTSPQAPAPGGPMRGGMQGGMHGGDMPGGGGMMMCPMMGTMGGGAMGGSGQDPKMMQMHGEMMKAMGEIMMKHGKALEGGRRP